MRLLCPTIWLATLCNAHFYARYISSLLKVHVSYQIDCAVRTFYKVHKFSEIYFKTATFLVWEVFNGIKCRFYCHCCFAVIPAQACVMCVPWACGSRSSTRLRMVKASERSLLFYTNSGNIDLE
ncbi:MAG: hypothetical protein ACJA2S_003378 [Cyclobacteriaceae bacterium]|jgi:hypothetical protein